jgi:hypothetical protein
MLRPPSVKPVNTATEFAHDLIEERSKTSGEIGANAALMPPIHYLTDSPRLSGVKINKDIISTAVVG